MNNKFLLLVPVFTLMLTYYYYFDEDLKRDNENILIYQYFNKSKYFLYYSINVLNSCISYFLIKYTNHSFSS